MTSETRAVADTHALIWHLQRSERLGARAREIMRSVDRGETELVIPTIVLAEAMRISERRVPVISYEELLAYIRRMPRVVVANLDMRVLQSTRELPASIEMHDRIIAATAIVFRATLLSRDGVLASQVETVW